LASGGISVTADRSEPVMARFARSQDRCQASQTATSDRRDRYL
jgi:hypothetical protein